MTLLPTGSRRRKGREKTPKAEWEVLTMADEIAHVVSLIKADERNIGALSTGEVIAAALIFNRMDWLPLGYKHPLDAIDRLGSNWMGMVMEHHLRHR